MEISVIMPIYNTQTYLKKSVNSVLNQSFTDFELILVNDGSTDMSLMLCKSFAAKDKRVRVIDLPHGGVAAARIAGINAAGGKYIAFVDSDDWAEREYLEHFYSAITENNADIAMCRTIYCEYSDSILKQGNILTEGVYSGEEMEHIKKRFVLCSDDGNVFVIWPSLWDKIYKSELLKDNIGYVDKCLTIGEDTVLVCAAVLDCKCFCVFDETDYHSIRRNNSLTHSMHTDFCEKILTLRRQLFKILADKKYSELNYKVDLKVFRLFEDMVRRNSTDEKIPIPEELKELALQLDDNFGCPEWQNTVKKVKKYVLD